LTYYLPDTSILSLLVRGNEQVHRRFEAAKRGGGSFALSAVVDFKVRRGLLWRRATTLQQRFEALVERFDYEPFEQITWLRGAELWAYSRSVGAPAAGCGHPDRRACD
jgi:predicted nucleic acid-binding protein